MTSTPLFDRYGRKIGFTEARTNGDIAAYDASGKFLGRYCAWSNSTHDKDGRRIGNANQLGRLFM